MNELLVSEINSDKSLLEKIGLLEAFIFASEYSEYSKIDEIINACQQVLEDIEDPLAQAEQLINELFVTQLLIDFNKDFWPTSSYKIEAAFEQLMIAPTLKSIVLRHIIEACGFDCDIVFVPEKVMLRIVCDDMYAIIFDPVTGESLNWQEFDLRMDDSEDLTHYQPADMSHASLIVKYLTALKANLIHHLEFDKALRCVDVLLALRPNDPFERRDRGFLLHQLDCFKVAVDDYRYFVKECPLDPAAQLLKIQLENIALIGPELH